MVEYFSYKGTLYPNYIKKGNAARFVFPLAEQFCQGRGIDVGGLPECHFPGSQIVNPLVSPGFSGGDLDGANFDYIFSSHTLEHIENYKTVLGYWYGKLRPGGIIFLYLPHPDEEYWHPRNCWRHKHSLAPEHIVYVLSSIGFGSILSSQRDLFWSFAVVGVKPSNGDER